MSIYFRLTVLVSDLRLEEDASLEFKYGKQHSVSVIIRKPNKHELPRDGNANHRLCIASAEYNPKPEILDKFDPSAFTQEITLIQKVGPLKPKQIDELTEPSPMRDSTSPGLPEKMQTFVNSVEVQLNEAAKETVRLLRWRCDMKGPHNPFAISNFEWSMDNSVWYKMPTATFGNLEVIQQLHVDEHVIHEVQKLATNRLSEPVAHVLYREAWEQRHRNSISSLVIGIAAVETGVKNCISQISPDAKWLIENLQSPPVDKILVDYLPKLTSIHVPDGTQLTLSSELIAPLKKSIGIRNNIIHGRKATLTKQHLEDTLLLIRDLLWLFDYLVGFDWAIHYIRDSTKNQLFRPIS